MRAKLTAALILLPAMAHAQSTPWDRNAMYVGEWECRSENSIALAVNEKLNKRATTDQADPSKHTLMIKENKDSDLIGRYGAQASQYDVSIESVGLGESGCYQLDMAGPHGADTTIIKKNGVLNCSAYYSGKGIYHFSIDLGSGRYSRVNTDGFVRGNESAFGSPSLEVGKCERK